METINEKIKRMSSGSDESWLEIASADADAREWIDKSTKIAIRIISFMHRNGINNVSLAEMVGVTPQYIGRILKGRENLTLETITKFEKTLHIVLVDVALQDSKFTCSEQYNNISMDSIISYGNIPMSLNWENKYFQNEESEYTNINDTNKESEAA